MRAALAVLLGLAGPVAAEITVAARTIPARSLITADLLTQRDLEVPGAVRDPAEIIGMEARVTLYPNRPIAPGDVGPPALVERNQLVPLVYARGALLITTEGRALDRGGAGDLVRVMNLASRTTVTARIGADGLAYVSP